MHLTREELEAGLGPILAAPAGEGIVELIVRRPQDGTREELEEGELDPVVGMVGDNWLTRGHRSTPDGTALPGHQLTIASARSIGLIAGERSRWALAGDNLFVDLDLSHGSLPVGARLGVGTAVVEVTPEPHKGCAKFAGRYGRDALRFVQTPEGRDRRLRGLHARVVDGGTVRIGGRIWLLS